MFRDIQDSDGCGGQATRSEWTPSVREFLAAALAPLDLVLAGMVAAGLTVPEICLYLAQDDATLLARLAACGIVAPADTGRRRRAGGRGYWTVEDTQRLITWWCAGIRVSDIAEGVGRSRSSVYGRARRLGLPPRRRTGLAAADLQPGAPYPWPPVPAEDIFTGALRRPAARRKPGRADPAESAPPSPGPGPAESAGTSTRPRTPPSTQPRPSTPPAVIRPAAAPPAVIATPSPAAPLPPAPPAVCLPPSAPSPDGEIEVVTEIGFPGAVILEMGVPEMPADLAAAMAEIKRQWKRGAWTGEATRQKIPESIMLELAARGLADQSNEAIAAAMNAGHGIHKSAKWVGDWLSRMEVRRKAPPVETLDASRVAIKLNIEGLTPRSCRDLGRLFFATSGRIVCREAERIKERREKALWRAPPPPQPPAPAKKNGITLPYVAFLHRPMPGDNPPKSGNGPVSGG